MIRRIARSATDAYWIARGLAGLALDVLVHRHADRLVPDEALRYRGEQPTS